jgi:hypothetical protein
VELASSPQWVQTNAPDVQTKLHKDMKVMILVDVATATSHFLSIQYTEHFCGYFFRIYSWFARQHPERHSNENLGLSGNYILLGESIPSKSKACSMVILKE